MKGILAVFCFCISAHSQVSVTTDHYGATRLGWNNSETAITTSNAGPRLQNSCTHAVDGAVYGQQLVAASVSISGVSHNLLVSATMHDSVYAFDADSCSSAIWQTSVGTSRTSYPGTQHAFYDSELGCISTPAIDAANSVVYVLCATPAPTWVLYQLSLTTGAVVASRIVTGTVAGTGDPNGGDNTSAGCGGTCLTFMPSQQLCASGLTLFSGHVYLSCGSFDDIRPYHGWIFGINTSTMAVDYVWCASPNGWGAGVWHARSGFSNDGTYLYALTGNGTNPDQDTNWSESVIKFTSSLSIADSYTPSNYATLNTNDSDLSSTRAMLMSDGHLIFGAKDYNVYNLVANCLGGLGGTNNGCSAPQIVATNAAACCTTHSGIYGAVCFDTACYFPNTNGFIYGFPYSSGSLGSSFTSSTYAYPGAMMTGVSNGSSGKMIMALTVGTDAEHSAQTGTLRLLSASDLSAVATISTIGNLTKFQPPTVANGKIYVGNYDSQVLVFSLIGNSKISGSSSLSGNVSIR